jgi:hypothetical protein
MASRGTFTRMLGATGLWKFLWIAGSAEDEPFVSRWDFANLSS